jgi:hypothetical protein
VTEFFVFVFSTPSARSPPLPPLFTEEAKEANGQKE